ncbi:MAG: hypothetical protein ACP5JG_00725 [Anaerolineae bacterium]
MQTKARRWPMFIVLSLAVIGLVRPVCADVPESAGSASALAQFTEVTVPGDTLSTEMASVANPPVVGADIPVYVEDNEQYAPAVAYNRRHDEYLVVWHNMWGGGGRDIYARRVSGQGEILSSFAVAYGPKDRAYPSVAYDPDHDRYLVVWMFDVNGDGSNWDIRGRFIPWQGPDASLGEFDISTWPTSQRMPKVVYNENPAWPEFLVVWANTPPAIPAYVSARRVFADGSGFPPGDGFTVDSDMADDYFNPDVAYNLARNEYLVVYSVNATDISATRLEGNGNVLGGGSFGVAGWPDLEQMPVVAACRTADQYFVAWQSYVNGTDFDIYGRYVSGAGSTGSVQHLALRGINEVNPDIACNPGAHHYLVVWQEQYSNLTGPYGVSGRMIHTDGTKNGDFIVVAPYTGVERTTPTVAAGPPGYLVVWEHDRFGTAYQDIHGRLVWPAVVYLPLGMRNAP